MHDCKAFVAVMGFDLTNGGGALGKGTIERCVGGIREARRLARLGCEVLLIASAGMARDLEKNPMQLLTMADMMCCQFERLSGTEFQTHSVRLPNGKNIWGSKAELRVLIDYAKARSKGSGYWIHVVSHWWHIPRLWLLCGPDRAHVKFVPVKKWNLAIFAELYKLPGQLVFNMIGKA